MNYLPLYLSGVLQYFSDENSIALKSQYNTSNHPTKKAIIGMIASALGYDRNDARSEVLFNSLNLKYSIKRNPILLNDFQTVKPLKSQNNYMNKYYKKNQFPTMENKFKKDSLIKRVQYLQDAEFVVYISGEDSLLENIYKAIQNPKYALFIGKRSCIPNKPIVQEFELIKEEELENVYDCI